MGGGRRRGSQFSFQNVPTPCFPMWSLYRSLPPLLLDCCYLDSDVPACLDHATVSRVRLTGCYLAGLTGTMLVAKELDLSGSNLTGPLTLVRAEITGQLVCSGAQLNGSDRDGRALFADRMETGGHAFLGSLAHPESLLAPQDYATRTTQVI